MSWGYRGLQVSLGCKDLLAYLALANLAKMASLVSQVSQVAKGSKACQACQALQVSLGSVSQAFPAPKVSVG